MMELADVADSKSVGFMTRVGSNPTMDTIYKKYAVLLSMFRYPNWQRRLAKNQFSKSSNLLWNTNTFMQSR